MRMYNGLNDPAMTECFSPTRYLHDFNQTTLNSKMEADGIELVAWNPLAVFRTLWRFTHYVTKWVTEDPQQQPQEISSRTSLALGQASFRSLKLSVLLQRFGITWPRFIM